MRLDAKALDLALCEVAAFVAVVHFGGFTVAARGLHVSQPGLSARVQRLERALGVVVIDRSVRRLTLTPQGRAFLPVAERVVRELTDATTALRSLPGAQAQPRSRPCGG
ncbi:LysR family transcriptional regulator [Microbacterium sp. ARD31]|uniref:LysR family transcriptional regulator n=1 Tax=Microbacterium sp. ARD31 TaxID=2962576 RepID=UPI0028824E5A|nr:LysR family transcriptional regulator [Microbacterium sp. ARD31]MDT0184976.1 LysR family transcriptional regulator [Microbacterium sp. ARD31]